MTLSEASADAVTVPDAVVPLAGAVIATLGGVVSVGGVADRWKPTAAAVQRTVDSNCPIPGPEVAKSLLATFPITVVEEAGWKFTGSDAVIAPTQRSGVGAHGPDEGATDAVVAAAPEKVGADVLSHGPAKAIAATRRVDAPGAETSAVTSPADAVYMYSTSDRCGSAESTCPASVKLGAEICGVLPARTNKTTSAPDETPGTVTEQDCDDPQSATTACP